MSVDDAAIRRTVTLVQRFVRHGEGAPEGNVEAPVGATYHREDGGASTAFYVKESGGDGPTGWVGK